MKRKLKLTNTKTNRNLAKKEGAKTHPRKVIILMSMPTPIHAITAVLDMPHDVHGRIDRAQEIITACTGNAYVTIDAATITAALNKLSAYADAATAAERQAAYPALHNTLKSFMGLFQDAANNNIDMAIVIIQSGGFKVKNIVVSHKHDFKAVNGALSGDVLLTAEGGPAGSVHNWKYSTNGIDYIWVRGTSDAHTHIAGFTRGAKVYFIHELSIHDEPQAQSQPFELTIS